MERIGVPVRSAVIFAQGGGIRPVWFEWRNRKHTITETNLVWRTNCGDTVLLHFAVSDGTAAYELVYNTRRHVWTLAALEPVS